MKKALLLLPVLALAACDRPKYDVTLSCEDGAQGTYLVEAKVYETKADLKITRLDKKLREKEPVADHLWLYNQLPLIDDTMKISLRFRCGKLPISALPAAPPENRAGSFTRKAIWTVWPTMTPAVMSPRV